MFWVSSSLNGGVILINDWHRAFWWNGNCILFCGNDVNYRLLFGACALGRQPLNKPTIKKPSQKADSNDLIAGIVFIQSHWFQYWIVTTQNSHSSAQWRVVSTVCRHNALPPSLLSFKLNANTDCFGRTQQMDWMLLIQPDPKLGDFLTDGRIDFGGTGSWSRCKHETWFFSMTHRQTFISKKIWSWQGNVC